MKRTITAAAAAALLLAGTAASSAADMPVKARPIVAPPVVWSWTGFYFGAHMGAGWGISEASLTGVEIINPPIGAFAFNLPFSQTSSSGFLGGVQAGYNWQSGWAVFGVQGDIAGANIKGTSPCLVILGCSVNTDLLASVTGRIGAVVLDRGLVYAKGGAAWQNTRHSVALPTFAIPGDDGPGFSIGGDLTSKEVTHFGWTIGLGTEWMITPNWTAFIEYNYYRFDTKNEKFPLNLAALDPRLAVNVNADLRNSLSVAKVGVNYKFDWGKQPVVARY